MYGSVAGNKNPVLPSSTKEDVPPTFVATIGIPNICASAMLLGLFSMYDV